MLSNVFQTLAFIVPKPQVLISEISESFNLRVSLIWRKVKNYLQN